MEIIPDLLIQKFAQLALTFRAIQSPSLHVTLVHYALKSLKSNREGLGRAEENNLPAISYFLIDFPTICIIKNRKTIEGSHCIKKHYSWH